MYYTHYHFHYCYNYHHYLVSFDCNLFCISLGLNVYFLMPQRRLKMQREGAQNSMIHVICTY